MTISIQRSMFDLRLSLQASKHYWNFAKDMYFYVGASRARRNLEIISNATKEDCALMVRSLNPKAPLRRDPISMLKVLLSCDVDLIE